ncbi:MAG: helix-turn-helix domain-containing protein [Clostridia bacterium]
MISRAIDRYGSITKASEKIGINSSTIHRKIKNGYVKL